MLCIPCRAVRSKSRARTPRGKPAPVLGYSGQCGSVWKDGEQEWNFPHDKVKANITLPVRQPKCYAWFVFPEVPGAEVRGHEGTENLSKWGPKSIFTEKASVQALSREINCGEHRSCHPALTISQPRAKEPSVFIPRCLGRAASPPAQTKCVHKALEVSNKQRMLVSSASCLHGDFTDTSGPAAGYIPPGCALLCPSVLTWH